MKTLEEIYSCPGCGLQSEARVMYMNDRHCPKCRFGFNLERALRMELGMRLCPACDVHISPGQWARHTGGRMHRFYVQLALVPEGVARGV
jgi:hypothetical protein